MQTKKKRAFRAERTCVSRAALQIKQATALDPPAPHACERDTAPRGKRARSWRRSPHVWIALTSDWIHSACFKPVQGKTTFYFVTRYPRAQDLSGRHSRQRQSPPGFRWRRLGQDTSGRRHPQHTAHVPGPSIRGIRQHHGHHRKPLKTLTISNLSTPKMNTKGKGKIKTLNRSWSFRYTCTTWPAGQEFPP